MAEAIHKTGSQEDPQNAGNGKEGEHDELRRVLLLFLVGQGLQLSFLLKRRRRRTG